MKKLSLGGKFDWFLNTLNNCGMFILDLSDEEIETFIFEDLIVDVTSSFSKKNLNELKENGLIDEEIEKSAYIFRKKILDLDNTSFWNVNSVKMDSNWIDIFELSDLLKKQIYEKWSAEEIEYLKSI